MKIGKWLFQLVVKFLEIEVIKDNDMFLLVFCYLEIVESFCLIGCVERWQKVMEILFLG